MSDNNLESMLKEHIVDVINLRLLNGYAQVDAKLLKNPKLKGATSAILYEVVASLKFVVKLHFQDTLFHNQGYKLLAKSSQTLKGHLVPPVFETTINPALALTPYINGVSLHDIVYEKMASPNWILEIYKDFLGEIEHLWKNTITAEKPDLRKIYLDRVLGRSRILEKELWLDDLLKFEVIINGESKGVLGEKIRLIEKRIGCIQKNVMYSCVVHGDEHAKNILVKSDKIGVDKKAWALIDYPNAKSQWDWIFSIAKMLHWWKVYYLIDCAVTTSQPVRSPNNTLVIEKRKKRIEITCDTTREYKTSLPYGRLSREVMIFFKHINKSCFKEEAEICQERLKIALFCLYYGAISRHLEKNKRFAIPILLNAAFDSLDKDREI